MDKKFSNVGLEQISGTSFYFGMVKASANELVNVLGMYEFGDGEKVEREWMIKSESGIIFTVYDWKEGYTSEKTVLHYHIGTFTKEDTEAVVNELKAAGLNAYVDSLF